LVTKSWLNNSDYWTVYYKLYEKVKIKFDENGLSIPDKKLDVHISSTQK